MQDKTVVLSDKTTVEIRDFSGEEYIDVDDRLGNTQNFLKVSKIYALCSVRSIAQNGGVKSPVSPIYDELDLKRLKRSLTKAEIDALGQAFAELSEPVKGEALKNESAGDESTPPSSSPVPEVGVTLDS